MGLWASGPQKRPTGPLAHRPTCIAVPIVLPIFFFNLEAQSQATVARESNALIQALPRRGVARFAPLWWAGLDQDARAEFMSQSGPAEHAAATEKYSLI